MVCIGRENGPAKCDYSVGGNRKPNLLRFIVKRKPNLLRFIVTHCK